MFLGFHFFSLKPRCSVKSSSENRGYDNPTGRKNVSRISSLPTLHSKQNVSFLAFFYYYWQFILHWTCPSKCDFTLH